MEQVYSRICELGQLVKEYLFRMAYILQTYPYERWSHDSQKSEQM